MSGDRVLVLGSLGMCTVALVIFAALDVADGNLYVLVAGVVALAAIVGGAQLVWSRKGLEVNNRTDRRRSSRTARKDA